MRAVTQLQTRIQLTKEQFRQRHNIVFPIPQGRNPQTDLTQAVKQVATEAAMMHHVFQSLIRRRHNPHIHRNFADTPQSVIRGAVQYPQQFYLHARFQFRNFIKEQSASIGQFE